MAARALLQAGGVPFAEAAEVTSADDALAAAEGPATRWC